MKALVVLLSALSALSVAQAGRIGCYYASWAIYRQGNGQFQPEDMDIQHCTHIVYAFAGVDPTTYEIYSLDTWADLPSGLNGYMRFTGLVAQNPSVVPMLSVGGWNEGSTKFSAMVSSDANRNAFINSVLTFLETYGFKGLDIDWEYPTQRGGVPADRDNLVLLLQGLRAQFTSRGYLLTLASSVNYDVVDQGYDVPNIMANVDFVNLLSYDYYTYLDGYAAHGEPTEARSDEDPTFSLDSSINLWLSKGANPAQINWGLAVYGHSFTLSDAANTAPHAPVSGAGAAGPLTNNAGSLAYYEICANNWQSALDPSWQAPYAFSGNQWVSYDDYNSIATKCALGKSLGLGGTWVYSIDTDDFRNLCGGGAFPLLTSLANNC